jgi:mRNA-degrading endonuclease toxin of MazEF toxin-antitoxin module
VSEASWTTSSLNWRAVAVIDQIRAISKGRLTERLGSLTVEEMEALAQAVREILELG